MNDLDSGTRRRAGDRLERSWLVVPAASLSPGTGFDGTQFDGALEY